MLLSRVLLGQVCVQTIEEMMEILKSKLRRYKSAKQGHMKEEHWRPGSEAGDREAERNRHIGRQ